MNRLVFIDLSPRQKDQKRVAIVGKAVTFDSGGLSLSRGWHDDDEN
jgi:leucyl aminopeptidase